MNGAQTGDPNHLGTNLRLVLGGDAAALNALLATLRPYLHLLVREQLASSEWYRADGSDIVQETLLRICRGLGPLGATDAAQFRGQTVPQFLNWVGVVVRSAVVQHLKHRKAAKRDPVREVPGSKIFPLLVMGMSADQKAERDEWAVRLASALEKLPEPRRDVLRFRFFDGLSFEEISQRTGKSVGALRVLSVRALAQLRAIMEAAP